MKQQSSASQQLAVPCRWQEFPFGLHYQKALQARLDRWWPQVCGSHLLKLGNLSIDLSSKGCMAPQQVSLPLPDLQDPKTAGSANRVHLPFRDGWFDACLLAHTLAYVESPHDTLREADRILSEQGWLLISDFSPCSLLGLGKLFPVLRRRPPYSGRLLSRARLIDWLYLLNYRVLSQCAFQALPWGGGSCVGELLDGYCSLFGCQYLIIARKQILPLQPIHTQARYQTLWQKPISIGNGALQLRYAQ